MRTSRSAAFVALLALTLPLSSQAASSSSSLASGSCDEDYEQLDTSTGVCECRDGFSGLGCRMCTDSDDSSIDGDEVCSSTFGDGYSCGTGFSYSADTVLKTYGCTLSKDLQALFPDGALGMSCDRNEDGVANCSAAVFTAKDTAQGSHAIDCTITQCTFATGETNAECENIDCKCGSACATTTKFLVEGTLSGKPAKIQVTNSTKVSIVIEGSPLPLSATCSASACERTGSSENDSTMISGGEEDSSDDDSGLWVAIEKLDEGKTNMWRRKF
ncbi:ATP-binding cassette sub- G member 2 [Phytophthora boehmeriae]|uniref:ATP-binding cassette sub- G member 2 n=1 Tax=Phytophthora boehmeriae TaxID=109152 RepID=A0A8T1WZ88_9STRA|nr:ATP-binding cassette sub- G member 2 [Phytophthora boehmeriae]